MRALHYRLLHTVVLLSGWCVQSPVLAADCALLPIEAQLQAAELRVDEPRYAEINYRKRLLRFVNSYYSNIAQDLLRGEGEYADSLHRLMGSVSDTCVAAYRELLVQEVNSQDFGMALWALRAGIITPTETAQTWPAN